jgi:hypothetical protein
MEHMPDEWKQTHGKWKQTSSMFSNERTGSVRTMLLTMIGRLERTAVLLRNYGWHFVAFSSLGCLPIMTILD